MTEAEYDSLKKGDKYSFQCRLCGKEVLNSVKKSRKYRERQLLFLCRGCSIKHSVKEKYGVDNIFQLQEIQDKSRQTCLERYGTENYSQSEEGKMKFKARSVLLYGVENPFQSEEIKRRIKETNLKRYGAESYIQSEEGKITIKNIMIERYGVEHPLQLDLFLDKLKKTCIERYGVENYSQTEESKQNNIQRNIRLYGVENYSQTEECKEKIRSTCLEKYGFPSALFTEECKEKIRNTCLEKYGVSSVCKVPEIRIKIRNTNIEKYGSPYPVSNRFKYNGETFDSSWELCYYIFCRDNGIKTERNPEPLYYYWNNQRYIYQPDFLTEGELVEIKGDHFFEGGKLINPYNRDLDGIAAEKQKCMVENKVKILKQKEIQPYIEYVKSKYGKDFLKKLKEEHG